MDLSPVRLHIYNPSPDNYRGKPGVNEQLLQQGFSPE